MLLQLLQCKTSYSLMFESPAFNSVISQTTITLRYGRKTINVDARFFPLNESGKIIYFPINDNN